jgi:hypothetical protein
VVQHRLAHPSHVHPCYKLALLAGVCRRMGAWLAF